MVTLWGDKIPMRRGQILNCRVGGNKEYCRIEDWTYDGKSNTTTLRVEVLTEFTPLVDLAREVLGEEHTVR